MSSSSWTTFMSSIATDADEDVLPSSTIFPDHAHLVLTSRADPALPSARLQYVRELVEIRAADLRFAAEEALAYLKQRDGTELTANDARDIRRARTEGWIRHSDRGPVDARTEECAAFIAGFAGDDRFIVGAPRRAKCCNAAQSVRRFMLQTSVASTSCKEQLRHGHQEQREVTAALDSLDRHNLFVIPLDDRRSGIDTTTCSPTFSAPGSSTKIPRPPPSFIGTRLTRTPTTASRPDAIRHAASDFDRARRWPAPMPEMRRGRHDATIHTSGTGHPDDVAHAADCRRRLRRRLDGGQLARLDARLMTSSSGSRCHRLRQGSRPRSSSTRPSSAPCRVRSRCTAPRWH